MQRCFLAVIGVLAFALISCQTPDRIRTLHDVDSVRNATRPYDIQRLIEAARTGDREVRAEALYILGTKRAVEALDIFISLGMDDSDFNVRAMGLRGIRLLGAAAAELDPMAIATVNVGLRDVSANALIEATKAAKIFKSASSLELLLQNLNRQNRWIRMATIDALSVYSDQRVTQAYARILAEEKDQGIRETLALAMRQRSGQ